uniref:CS domain-containing protein n=1 Tax=Globisporangium ultimum (strain ATCC 200006 / CBS 805.95 / DAOM BR144) TaxID=431595 RepID=K3X6D0_GLOUD
MWLSILVPVGNGGSTETYTWTQSLDDTTIYIDLPDGTRSKDLDCKITSSHIRVALKNTETPLLDGELPEKVRSDESLWSIESNQTLQISLEKIKKTWWASALKGDPEIDTNQVDSTRSIQEYDSATQMAIRKAMFDQQQQRLSQPTSDVQMIDAMMANARKAANSPI